MLEQLTEKQVAAIPGHRKKWLEYATSTEPADRPRAEAAVKKLCRAANVSVPTQFMWVPSPYAGAVAVATLEHGANPTADQIAHAAYYAIHGQQEAPWAAFYTFFRDHCGIAVPDELQHYVEYAQSAGWTWVVRDTAVMSERQTSIHLDTEGQLHHPTEAAIAFADGFALYMWHGVPVPKSLILEGWGPEQILQERNAEIRRCAIEKLGWDKFVEGSDFELVAKAPDPGNDPYELFLYELPRSLKDIYDEPARLLLCTNGTEERNGVRRRFGIPVPASFSDPVAAAAATFGKTKEQYLRLAHRR